MWRGRYSRVVLAPNEDDRDRTLGGSAAANKGSAKGLKIKACIPEVSVL